MQVKLKVTYANGKVVEAVAKPKDIVAFERQYDLAFAAFAEDARFEWLCYLAWSPLHRQGRETRPFDEFMDDLEDVEDVEDETPPVPFESAPSDEASPS